jgi:hypothetical protein
VLKGQDLWPFMHTRCLPVDSPVYPVDRFDAFVFRHISSFFVLVQQRPDHGPATLQAGSV